MQNQPEPLVQQDRFFRAAWVTNPKDIEVWNVQEQNDCRTRQAAVKVMMMMMVMPSTVYLNQVYVQHQLSEKAQSCTELSAHKMTTQRHVTTPQQLWRKWKLSCSNHLQVTDTEIYAKMQGYVQWVNADRYRFTFQCASFQRTFKLWNSKYAHVHVLRIKFV